MKKHEHTHELEEHCHCHEHEHGHEQEEHCHCHEHEHGHEQEEHCHCHEHEETDCGCGCGCSHEESETPKGRLILRYALGALPVLLGFLPFLPTPIRIVSSVAAYVLFGFEVWREMLKGFGRKRFFTEFTLMCVATLGAFALGEYADAAAVMYLYSLGETLSGIAYARSKGNISELLSVSPEYATVLREGRAARVSPEEVALGETVLVSAGERIPLDGVILSGGGFADASSVTGESKPLELYEGVSCPSGAILGDGAVEIRVTAIYENSVVARLSAAVREAQGRKSAAEKKIARFARIFTPIAFCIAFGVALIGALVTGEIVSWIRTGLTVLVVSCPCSLVLSVPLTYFAGIGAGASEGIIFRGGEVMDRMCKLRGIAFDKTGTLSESALRYDGAELLGSLGEEDFLSLAYDVLIHSPHMAARAFCQGVRAERRYTITQVENVGGRGVVCLVRGKRTCFGNAALMREQGIDLEDSPTTAIFGAMEGELLGKLSFSAPLKAQTAHAIASLRAEGVERIAVLSGDGERSVSLACAQAGIDEYYGSLTPEEKSLRFAEMERKLREKHKKGVLGYCGDGLNDSAVIAGAEVGIAMGGCGSALTVSSADVVLMDDDPAKVVRALRLARRTSRIAGQNIALSLGIKIAVLAVGILLSALWGRSLPMELAIVADVGAAVLAVLNALRAAKRK